MCREGSIEPSRRVVKVRAALRDGQTEKNSTLPLSAPWEIERQDLIRSAFVDRDASTADRASLSLPGQGRLREAAECGQGCKRPRKLELVVSGLHGAPASLLPVITLRDAA